MNVKSPWFRALLIGGLAAMLVGAVDPLEGSLVVLAGAALAAVAGARARNRQRRFLVAGFALVAAGVGALWLLSALGGIGGDTGRPMIWGLVVLPYPVGWFIAIVGAVLGLVESYRRGTPVGHVVV